MPTLWKHTMKKKMPLSLVIEPFQTTTAHFLELSFQYVCQIEAKKEGAATQTMLGGRRPGWGVGSEGVELQR